MDKKITEVESEYSTSPEHDASSGSTHLEIPITHMDNQLKYTEAEVDCIIEKEEAEERRKVQLEYAAELAVLKEELAIVKRMNEVTREEEDIHFVFELNFLSDTCLSESELRHYQNLLSEFDEFETGVVQCNKKLQHQTMHPANEGTHNSFQSLNSSFEDLQYRYKQLREDCAKKVEALKEAMKMKSKLEKMNQQFEARFQSFLKDTTNDVNRANTEYSGLQKKLASDLALEKAAAKKVELEVASLDKNLQKLEQEKQQLSQICEELMKELSQR